MEGKLKHHDKDMKEHKEIARVPTLAKMAKVEM
jgi:hypothetical protein